MTEGWENMSSGQRQETFLAKWASGEGIPFVSDEAKALYRYRAGLIMDAVKLKKTPDRVPVVPLAIFAPIMLYGYSGRQAMFQIPHILGKACLDYTRDYDVDATVIPPMVMYGPALDLLGYQLYKWPGHGIKDELSYRFVGKGVYEGRGLRSFYCRPK